MTEESQPKGGVRVRPKTGTGPGSVDKKAMREYGKQLLTYGVWAFSAVSIVLLGSLILGAVMTSKTNESIDFIRVNKSIQVTMGMVCGLLFAFFGVALSWAGISGSVSGAIDNGKLSASLNTASPGIVLMLCGTVLIGISVTREVRTRTVAERNNGALHSQASHEAVGANGVPPIERTIIRHEGPQLETTQASDTVVEQVQSAEEAEPEEEVITETEQEQEE